MVDGLIPNYSLAPSFPRRRESSCLNNPRAVRQNQDFVRFAECLSRRIPAFAGMTLFRFGGRPWLNPDCPLGKLGAKKPFVVSLSNHEWPFDKLRANGFGANGLFGLNLGGALFLLLAFHAVPALAEELPDPTRPPASIAAPVIAASGVAGSPSPVLQSIIISKTRRAAIIGGETVELGGKYGDAKLIEVNEGSVVLRSAQGRQVMSLFPDVKITAAKVPAGNDEQKVKSKLPSPISKAQPERQKANRAAAGEKK